MKFARKQYDITHLNLGMSLHYLGKLKIHILCRYSADMKGNANKLHFSCTDFNSSMSVSVYAECFYVFFYQTLVIVAEYHGKHCSAVFCDEFPVSQIDRKLNE